MADENGPGDDQLTRTFERAEQSAPPAYEPVTPRTVFRWAIAAGLGLGVVYIGYNAIYTIRDTIVQVLIAIFLAISLDPLVRWMVAHRVKRGQAVLIIFVALLLLVTGFLMLFIPPLVHQAGRLTTD